MLQTRTRNLFDTIITNEKNSIRSFQLRAHHPLTRHLRPNKQLEDVFENWDVLQKGQVYAERETQPYLLMYQDVESESSIIRMYNIFDGHAWQKKVQEIRDLQKAAQELDAIIESSFDGIYITDRNGVTLRTNSAIERITGIPKSYYIGKNINQLIKRGFLTESATVNVMEKKQRVSIVQRNQNGKETLMTGTPIFNEDGDIDKIVTNIRDLTELNQLHEALNREQTLRKKQKKALRAEDGQSRTNPPLKNAKMKDIYQLVERLASFDPTILILGETGVGKDLLAKHIYETGLRSDTGQLVKINCGAIPKDLIESELFGYDKGSFSGANRSGKPGLFELADKGILFLDEIGEMPLDLQVKLLHVIQEKSIMRVGGTKQKKVDVQLIAATNKDLKKMVVEGTFREDLFYRLQVVPIHIPPLRERKEDLDTLVQSILTTCCERYRIHKSLHASVLEHFFDYHWPGNVRELANLIERLVLTVPEDVITAEMLPEEFHFEDEKSDQKDCLNHQNYQSLKSIAETAEKVALQNALETYKTTYELAAFLKSSQATIVRKLKKYNLRSSDS